MRARTDAHGPRCTDIIVDFHEVQIAVEHLNAPVSSVRHVDISLGVRRDRVVDSCVLHESAQHDQLASVNCRLAPLNALDIRRELPVTRLATKLRRSPDAAQMRRSAEFTISGPNALPRRRRSFSGAL